MKLKLSNLHLYIRGVRLINIHTQTSLQKPEAESKEIVDSVGVKDESIWL